MSSSPISGKVIRNKHHVRAAFRSTSLLVLIGLAIFGFFSGNNGDHHTKTMELHQNPFQDYTQQQTTTNTNTFHHRRLEEEAACDDVEKNVADPKWLLGFYIAGVLYMFLALAIVCDEFFVPALEEMSSPRRLNLSMDVAGATLMAAGGSAPELFTALFGTFKESAVGFGTIVGSAVFNVLFVIGMCSIFSKEILSLTWWPLFRDSAYYLVGLTILATFVGVATPGQIVLWEALVLLLLYVGYVLVMAYNEKLYSILTGGKRLCADEEGKEVDSAEVGGDFVMLEAGGTSGERPVTLLNKNKKTNSLIRQNSQFWNGSFRAGILKMLEDPKGWGADPGTSMVAKINGDVDEVFSHVDKDKSGHVTKEELKLVLDELKCYLSKKEFEDLFNKLDKDKSGSINKREFTQWYFVSEQRMLAKAEETFHRLDTNKSGTVDREEVRALLQSVDPTTTEGEVTSALQEMYQSGHKDQITLKEFEEWFAHSFICQRKKEKLEEESKGIYASLRPPRKKQGKRPSCLAYVKYIICLPLVLLLAMTVPDVRVPGRGGRFCYLTFLLSIAWIGVFSYFMVDWAETIGATLAIPDIVMGLTFLAAGTSVPDLLSSVIVARMGEGDMAVSSSIGSNIFDILVGLPLPWLAYTAYPGKPNAVEIGADGVGISILILVAMIVLIIVTIHCNRWKLTKAAGAMMFVFYFAFLAQAIVRELPFETCG